MIAMDEIGILKMISVVIWRSEGKSRWVALFDGYESTRGDYAAVWSMCMTEKAGMWVSCTSGGLHPPLFFRHPEVPAFFVQFDGTACALSRTSKHETWNGP